MWHTIEVIFSQNNNCTTHTRVLMLNINLFRQKVYKHNIYYHGLYGYRSNNQRLKYEIIHEQTYVMNLTKLFWCLGLVEISRWNDNLLLLVSQDMYEWDFHNEIFVLLPYLYILFGYGMWLETL